jgi:tetratricopeptide (TPR) repeat protein
MRARLAVALAFALALGGCGRHEVTVTERQEGALAAGEAAFAVQLKDWKRAADNYAKAAGLCPDSGDYWFNLGLMRMRLGDHPAARAAFKSALPDYEAAFERTPSDTRPVLSRVYILILLGDADQAREVLAKARARHPDDVRLKTFDERHNLDKIIADPNTKANSP